MGDVASTSEMLRKVKASPSRAWIPLEEMNPPHKSRASVSEVWGSPWWERWDPTWRPPGGKQAAHVLSLNANTKGPHSSHQKRLPFILVY